MAIDINRSTTITLPSAISSEIIQKTQENSGVMRLAGQIELPGNGVTIPVVTGDPTASWVGETDEIGVSRHTLATKVMQAYKLAVLVPFSNEFKRDAARLYDALVARLPLALAEKFDATVFGNVAAPGSNFDTLDGVTAQSIAGKNKATYQGLVAADEIIGNANGITNGFVFSPTGKSLLLSSTDDMGRPLFINSAAEGAVPVVLGAPTYISKGAYKAGTPNTVGFVGDWTQAMYGTVEGVKIAISDQATITDGETTINLFQRDMFAVRAEIELGFRCDQTCFVKLTDATA